MPGHLLEKAIAVSTWVFMGMGVSLINLDLVPNWYSGSNFGVCLVVVYNSLFVLALVSHLKALTKDPGYTPELPVPDQVPLYMMRFCNTCNQWKPDKSHHCRRCRRCIHKMDHHCPWINNCVGGGNQKHFTLFLLYVELLCVVTLGVLGHGAYSYFGKTRFGFWTLIFRTVTGTVAVVFLLFTMVMISDQLETIVYDSSQIDRVNLRRGEELSLLRRVKKVMGENPLNWLNPFSDPPALDFTEKLFKFEKPQQEESFWKNLLIVGVFAVISFLATYYYFKVKLGI
mmetsp:Transcript_16121/g.23324  ORF Transcript_16121/g.23324 Transcript_16121/m.23324 type:complete len:285 (+) Transcript_16121:28-882(+)